MVKEPDNNSQGFQEFLSMMEIPRETLEQIAYLSRKNLGHVVKQIYASHPDIQDFINAKLTEAVANQRHDKAQQLIDEANLPFTPHHAKLSDFDPSCLNEKDMETYTWLKSLDFLHSDYPNITIFGPKRFGAEKLASGFGDAICRSLHTVYYIKFHHLISLLITHGVKTKKNNEYEELLKKECLIIEDFAGESIHDIDLLNVLEAFLESRLETHKKAFNKALGSAKRKAAPDDIIALDGGFKPCVTIITTSRSYLEWDRFFDCDKMKVVDILSIFHGPGTIIFVDETNKPDTKEQDTEKSGQGESSTPGDAIKPAVTEQ